MRVFTSGGRHAWAAAVACLAAFGADTPAVATPGDTHSVRVQATELRAAPHAAAPVLMSLQRGRRVIEFRHEGAWLRVAVIGLVGREGWVPAADLARERRPPGAVSPGRASPPAESGPDPAVPTFVLRVAGSPARAFTGECDLVDAGGARQEVALSGLTPAEFRLSAAAVACIVRKRDFLGRLRVRLSRDGTLVAAEETAAAFNHIRVRSAGPWGSAAAVRGTIPTPRLSVAPEAAGRTVPPLHGPLVPPLRGPLVPPLRGP